MNKPVKTEKCYPGDRIRFRANQVRGVVIRNHGPAVNTETGNDVITWRCPDGGHCVHDAAELELDRTPAKS